MAKLSWETLFSRASLLSCGIYGNCKGVWNAAFVSWQLWCFKSDFFLCCHSKIYQYFRCLNRAMKAFDATVVVPTNFVLFTISAILSGKSVHSTHVNHCVSTQCIILPDMSYQQILFWVCPAAPARFETPQPDFWPARGFQGEHEFTLAINLRWFSGLSLEFSSLQMFHIL